MRGMNKRKYLGPKNLVKPSSLTNAVTIDRSVVCEKCTVALHPRRMTASSLHRGESRIFFRRGCTRLLLCFNTNTPHSFFFLQNFSCIKKPQVISGRGGGAHPLHSPPRSAPASCLAHLRILSKVFLLASISSILWRFKSLQCYSLQIRVSRMGRKQTLQTRSLRKASGYTYLLCMALSHFQDPKVIVGLCVVVI